MTTQIEVVDINDNTNDNDEFPAVEEVKSEEVKSEEVKPKAKPRAKANAK